MEHSFNHDALIFKAFCDENRLRILSLLCSGEKCACKLLEHLDIGQPALSYHMKILVESGIVESRQEGKWTHYNICGDAGSQTADLISKYTENCTSSDTKPCCG
jgi:ArsR family transcriptional regulator